MSWTIQFIAREQRDAGKNLEDFIRLCREELTVFGKTLDFDSSKWDVTDSIEYKGRGNERVHLLFSDFDSTSRHPGDPMHEPFLSFAKAYMRYMHGMQPTKQLHHRLGALRALERALAQREHRLERIDAATFTQAAILVAQKYGAMGYHVGRQLEAIASFLTKHRLSEQPILWRNPIKRPQDRNRIGADADRRRKEKLPSQAALGALAQAFQMAEHTPDIIVTSAAAILCGNPGRINELLALPEDCEVEQTRSNGTKAYGLRWWTSKDAEPMVKWVIPSMVEVVREAIGRLREHTNEARRMARWYEKHPQEIYLPEGLEHLRGKKRIHFDDIAALLGTQKRYVTGWLRRRAIAHHNSSCSFGAIERAIVALLPINFPYLIRETGLKYSKALFVVRVNEMHQGCRPYRCMLEPITPLTINNGLGGSIGHGVSSVFSRFGLQEPDGSPIKITSHQFRHWLNTLAQEGGLSQLDIAKWSGRKDIRQNEAYDHMSGDDLVAKLREIAGKDVNLFGIYRKVAGLIPISRDEFIRLQIPAVHTTELGYCVHDWTLLPCPLHRDCTFCSEHWFIKGDSKRMERIRQCLKVAEEQLAMAEDAAASGYAGADRWSDHQRAVIDRLRNLVEIFDDPKVAIGAIIRLATTQTAGQVQIAVEERARHDAAFLPGLTA